MQQQAPTVYLLKPLLEDAEQNAYAVGSFSPRCTPEVLARGADAVQAMVVDKMVNFVGSNNQVR